MNELIKLTLHDKDLIRELNDLKELTDRINEKFKSVVLNHLNILSNKYTNFCFMANEIDNGPDNKSTYIIYYSYNMFLVSKTLDLHKEVNFIKSDLDDLIELLSYTKKNIISNYIEGDLLGNSVGSISVCIAKSIGINYKSETL